MQAIRTIQNVSGSTLTIQLPADFHASRVEVIILPVEEDRPRQEGLPETDTRFADFIQPKPPLTEADRQLFTQRSNPLAGTVRSYAAPFDPAVPPDDWASHP
jgi:hypothetical protein